MLRKIKDIKNIFFIIIMKNILVTGGCGFIASNFLNLVIKKYPPKINPLRIKTDLVQELNYHLKGFCFKSLSYLSIL